MDTQNNRQDPDKLVRQPQEKANKVSRSQKIRRQQADPYRRLKRMLFGSGFLAVFLLAAILFRLLEHRGAAPRSEQAGQVQEGNIPRPNLDVQLLTVNEYSRPGTALSKVRGIVIHYTGNPGTGAQANRNYFEGLKDSHVTKASSHFVIGLNGEIIQCIPSSEIAYASNARNKDTIAIECCIADDTGRFGAATYDAMVHLTAWLVEHFGLRVEDVIRHYDVTGKACPKYFVEFPAAWEQFLADVQDYLVSYEVF